MVEAGRRLEEVGVGIRMLETGTELIEAEGDRCESECRAESVACSRWDR